MEQGQKKAVVVGGAGFIGSHITDEAVSRGWDVHVIDNLSGGKRQNVNSAATFHEVDIRNYDDIAPVIAGADYVFHLAALPRVQYSIDYPKETHEVNVNGTLNVLLAAKNGGVKRLVYSASSSAYGDQKTLPLHEGMLPNPLSPYGLHKYIGEHYARVFTEVYGTPSTVSLRYFNVYGPRLDPEGAYALVIGKFLKLRSEGKPLTITGDGEQTRDFTHVRDVVRANLLAMDCAVADGRALNIGRGKSLSVNEIAAIIGGPATHHARRPGDPQDTLADLTQTRAVLGWEPEVATEDGIREMMRIAGLPATG